MAALIFFFLLSVLIPSGILFFNKGEKSEEIKGLLKEIWLNLKDLFSNFKKLFLIISELLNSLVPKDSISAQNINSNQSSTGQNLPIPSESKQDSIDENSSFQN